ncbi:hypothetical protein EMPS_06997 [Entomortierella parvispora]|uniref:Major facilitator superfamily (MFS) profile domain-containing protein n=1 Tax=Entomortierella parvispora TaxID=205924 RepID=A0A9P3HDG1_9FUNG|nr:hypothetical protein EMPS_06997 [Entomortierella parvispora]
MEDIVTKPQRTFLQSLKENKGLLLAIVSFAQMLDIINVASVTIVLPKVMVDVGYKVDQLQWVSSAYSLAYGAFLLLGGRLGDLFGHRNIYILGVTWFSIWSIVNGFSHSPVMLSISRALQGMGAGFTVPSALAILTTTYPVGPERTRALSIFGGTGAVGSVVGVLMGGILGSTIGWRWLFYITGIIGSSLVIAGFLVIPADQSQGKVEDRRIDFIGLTFFSAGIVTIIYYLSEGPASGWAVAKTLTPLIVGLVLLVAFVVVEYKIDYPIMPLHIWRSRRLVGACATALVMMAAMNAHFYFTSLAFQNVLGYSPLRTSLAFIVHGVGAIIGVGILSVVVNKVRTKIIIIVGWLFLIASGVLWAQLKAGNSYWSVPFPALILNLIAMVCIWLCCQINSVADAADEDQGVVGAVYNTCLQVGAPIGIAISNIVANDKNSPTAVGAQLLPGYRDAFYSYVVLAAVGLVVTLIVNPNNDSFKKGKQPDIEQKIEEEDDATEIRVPAPLNNDKEEIQESNIYEQTSSKTIDSAPATVFEGSSASLEKPIH